MPQVLTILYYTASIIPEPFAEKVRLNLLNTINGTSIISVTQEPIDFGQNICLGKIGVSAYNVYKQILEGAMEATTPYIACCEDDTLYPLDHFEYNPPENSFAYNTNRWTIHEDTYFFSYRANMSQCISATKLMIDTLKTRFEKYQDKDQQFKHWGEPGRYEKRLGLPFVEAHTFESKIPTIHFSHPNSLFGVRRSGSKSCKTLPYWGSAKELWERYYG